MKILIFNWRDIKNPLAGGAEILTHQMAKRWIEAKHKVILFTSFFKGCLKRENIDGVEIFRAGNRKTVYFWAFVYYKKYFKGNVDLVIDEINTLPFFTPFYVKEPVIAHINQLARKIWFYETVFFMAILGFFLESLCLRAYRKIPVITISQSTKDSLIHLGFARDNCYIIPMGINHKPLAEVSQKEKNPTLLYVGRLKRSKRVHHILESFRILKDKVANLNLWVVGTGDQRYKKKLENYVRKFGLRNVTFFNHLVEEEKLKLMQSAHAIIVTSAREGWGLIVTEANASGTPAITYNVPGLRDSNKNNTTGLICKENNPTELAQTILNFLSNENLMIDLSRAALSDSKCYSWDKTGKESLEIIERIVSNFRRN